MEQGESTDRTTGDYLLFFLAAGAFTVALIGFLFGSVTATFSGGAALVVFLVWLAFRRSPQEQDDW